MAILVGFSGAVIQDLERTKKVSARAHWKKVKAKRDEWQQHLEHCPGALVGEPCKHTPSSFLNVANASLGYMDVHRRTGINECDAGSS